MIRSTSTFLVFAGVIAAATLSPARVLAWGAPELVKDIRPGSAASRPEKLLAIGGRLFFGADDGVKGVEPMASDGSAAGTIPLGDLWPGANSSLNLGCTTCNAIAIGNTVYFSATSGSGGFRLWKTDGTPAGTELVYPSATASDLADVAGGVFFAGSTGGPAYLYSSDGTTAGTARVTDAVALTGSGMVGRAGRAYFPASNGITGVEVWSSDGTAVGTTAVSQIAPGGADAHPAHLTRVGTSLFFSATNGSAPGICVTDGTLPGTAYLAPVRVGVLETTVGQIVDLNGTALFIGDDGTSGRELWKSDGTPGGTQRVKDILPGSGGGLEGSMLVVVGNVVYFAARDGVHGRELWKSDGTTAGTVMVKDIDPSFGDFGSSQPQGLARIQNTLFFRAASSGVVGQQVWTSDGTAAGTVQLPAIFPGGASQADGFTEVGGAVYFSATDGVHGIELWKVPAGPVGVAPDLREPAGVTLSHARPNPARSTTRLTYSLAAPQRVRVRLFDMSGRQVASLEDREAPAGAHEIALDGRNLPTGVYFCRLETAAGSLQRKVLFAR